MATVREIRRERIVGPDRDAVSTSSAITASSVINWILGIVETLLVFRFLFKLFAANPANGFVSFIYSLTEPLVAPFRGIFGIAQEGGAVFESATVVAMVVYAVIAYLIARLFLAAADSTTERVVQDDL